MNAKEAVVTAKHYVADMFADENATNIGLEEVVYVPDKKVWMVTVGFSRPWNTVKNALTAMTGDPGVRRTFKVLTIRDGDGEVIALTGREPS